jgi:hypothetical protein
VRVRCLQGCQPDGTTSDCPRWDPSAEHEDLLAEADLDGLDELDKLTDPADQAGAQANAYAPDLTPYPFEQLCDRLEALGRRERRLQKLEQALQERARELEQERRQ